jgi:copper chaperone CopZ
METDERKGGEGNMREQVLLEIKGMHCPDCPGKVERNLRKLDGVKEIIVDYEKESGYVSYDKAVISIETITDRISELGFEAKNMQGGGK